MAIGSGEFRAAAARAAVPPALVKETICSAASVASGQTVSFVVSGATASLVKRVLWSMAMVKIKTAAVGLAMVGVLGFGGSFAARFAEGSRFERQVGANQPRTAERAVPDSDRTAQRKSTKARTQEHLNTADFFCMVPGGTSIAQLLPDGSNVTKGQLICELNTAVLKDSLTNQRITTESAKANYLNAVIAREESEIDARAYSDDLFPREQKELKAERELGKAELSVAEERLNNNKAIGGNIKLHVMESELEIARAKLALTKAESRLHILTTYTHAKKLRELSRSIERARSEELAKGAVSELELGKEKKLEKQIAACKIVAPFDGIVVYGPTLGRPALEAGSIVQSGERLFRVLARLAPEPIKP